jgi:hypothetical protein
MPRRPGQRRLTVGRREAQPKDDQAGDSAILDQALAAQAKRARRRPRGRAVLEITADFVADFVANLLP